MAADGEKQMAVDTYKTTRQTPRRNATPRPRTNEAIKTTPGSPNAAFS